MTETPTGDGNAPDRTAESATWRALLDGTDPGLRMMRRRWKHVPRGPRCKVCAAPFSGIGAVATRFFMHGRSNANPTMCGLCFRQLADHPGGAEVEVSIVFADIRGSTAIAERIGPAAFSAALQEFYTIAARAVEGHGGFVDKYLGDGVMALFVPVMAGEMHGERALSAAIELVDRTERSRLAGTGIRVGAGVHTGEAFVGVLGTGDKLDFSALGDPVNVAARLGAIAGPGEVVASRAAWVAAGRSATEGEARVVELAGRREPLDVIVANPAAPRT